VERKSNRFSFLLKAFYPELSQEKLLKNIFEILYNTSNIFFRELNITKREIYVKKDC